MPIIKVMKIAAWNIFIFIALVTISELVFFTLTPNDSNERCLNCSFQTHQNNIGLWNPPNSQIEVSKYCGENICYKSKYSFDQLGRRITYKESKKLSQHLLLFGGSFNFGEGLRDEQTLDFKLHKLLETRNYNFSAPGGGAARMLYFLQSNIQIPEPNGYALYYLISDHINRIAMDSKRSWLWKTPGHKLELGKIKSIGFKDNLSSPYSYFIKAFHWLSQNSFTLQYFHLEIASLDQQEKMLLLLETIKTSRDLYEQKFNGKFFVLYDKSQDKIPNWLLTQIENHKIKTISIDHAENLFSQKSKFICPCDNHPSALYNQHTATIIRQTFLNSH